MAIWSILLSVSFGSILTTYSSTFKSFNDPTSTLGNSVTEIVYSRSFPSPNDFKSILGWPAGLILLSSRALVVVSFNTLSITSPYTAFPNCLFNISVGTFPGLNPFKTTSF